MSYVDSIVRGFRLDFTVIYGSFVNFTGILWLKIFTRILHTDKREFYRKHINHTEIVIILKTRSFSAAHILVQLNFTEFYRIMTV